MPTQSTRESFRRGQELLASGPHATNHVYNVNLLYCKGSAVGYYTEHSPMEPTCRLVPKVPLALVVLRPLRRWLDRDSRRGTSRVNVYEC